MPTLKIQTNVALPPPRRASLLQDASSSVAALLGKSEGYVMVSLEINPDMCFARSSAPLAYLELKSLGLPEARTAEFSAALCELVGEHCGVSAERVYIEFSSPERHLFGWNAKTF